MTLLDAVHAEFDFAWIIITIILSLGSLIFKKRKKDAESPSGQNPTQSILDQILPSSRSAAQNELPGFYEMLGVFTQELKTASNESEIGAVKQTSKKRTSKRFDNYRVKRKQKNTFADLLDDPKSFRQAFILSEILNRPKF